MYKKITICVISTYLILLFANTSIFAKYSIEEKILIAKIDIDKTSPEIQVDYIRKEQNNNISIIVQIQSNEEIEEVEGWNLSQDKKKLQKEYSSNTEENIKIQDLFGNGNRFCKFAGLLEFPVISEEKY